MMAVRRLQFELQKCSTPTQLESKPKCILCEHPKQKNNNISKITMIAPSHENPDGQMIEGK
jgi:recombinational DNA repair protein RecR